jgi:hypothetical protein
VIGDGRGVFVEPIVALPKTLVGTPSTSGEKLALMLTVSSACATAAAVSRNAQLSSAAVKIRVLGIIIAISTPVVTAGLLADSVDL